ncbi:hypothetical protein A7C99_1810 [Trichophyton rubrum]|uniref:Secreted protein n=1 Tax=Trichophyton rubrum TaxID=5551 RepID=A0A178F2N2_TRIRU|nr:hypothetical protein H100_04208 [Trichophyton rubrum MR850]OAL66424.1 hypothetical protein A7C99_1810 [Trichophyton rubrum]
MAFPMSGALLSYLLACLCGREVEGAAALKSINREVRFCRGIVILRAIPCKASPTKLFLRFRYFASHQFLYEISSTKSPPDGPDGFELAYEACTGKTDRPSSRPSAEK